MPSAAVSSIIVTNYQSFRLFHSICDRFPTIRSSSNSYKCCRDVNEMAVQTSYRKPISKSSSASPDPTTEVACTNVGKVRLANLTQSLLHSRKAKQSQEKRETVRIHTLTCVVGLSFSLAGARGSLDSLLI